MILPLALAAQPIPLDYKLPEPVQTVEEPAPAPEGDDPKLYRISDTKWTDDKVYADRVKRAKVRRVLHHALNAADLVTSVICLEARDNCKEGNPIYGQSTEALVAGKVATAVLFEVFRDEDGGNEVIEWISIGLMTAVVGNNITVVF